MAVEYVTQTLAEVLAQGINIRFTQILGETMVKYDQTTRRITQTFAEILGKFPPSARATSIYAEVMVTRAANQVIIHTEQVLVTYEIYPFVPMWEVGNGLVKKPRVIASPAGDAMQQRAPDGRNTMLRTTSILYRAVSTGDKEVLRQFLANHRGSKPFYWKPRGYEDTEDYTVWVSTNFTYTQVEKGFFDMTVDLEEVPDFPGATITRVTSIEVVGDA